MIRSCFWVIAGVLCAGCVSSEPQAGAGTRRSDAEFQFYHAPGTYNQDFWFIKDAGVYHAFYLQSFRCFGKKGQMTHVGHATSKDLVHWTDQGPAIAPEPKTWNDLGIATGSVAANAGKYWMVFTGKGSTQRGIGLAVSDNLMDWKKVGDGPVAPLGESFESVWQAKPLTWKGVANPYIYPEAVDGWFYMIINSQDVNAPVGQNGCLTTMRSRDLQHWEPHGVLAYPGWFDRMETPSLWHRNGRWYLSFGGALDHGLPDKFVKEVPASVIKGREKRGNYVFTSERFEGPYEPAGTWWITLPDADKVWGYIIKVFPGPSGKDVLFCHLAPQFVLSRPYEVNYDQQGSLVLSLIHSHP